MLTVELDPQRAEAATKVFAERGDVTVRCSDWREAFAGEEPFDLLFVDGGGPDMLEPEHRHEVIELVRIGGTFIIDDITAQEFWDASWNGRSDQDASAPSTTAVSSDQSSVSPPARVRCCAFASPEIRRNRGQQLDSALQPTATLSSHGRET